MTNKQWFQMTIVVGLAFGLVASIPDIIRYVIIQNALSDFNETLLTTMKESEQQTRAFNQEMAKRQTQQAQAASKKKADDLYHNAACVLVEDTGACSCIDKRTAKSIVMEQSTCKVRAQRYNY